MALPRQITYALSVYLSAIGKVPQEKRRPVLMAICIRRCIGAEKEGEWLSKSIRQITHHCKIRYWRGVDPMSYSFLHPHCSPVSHAPLLEQSGHSKFPSHRLGETDLRLFTLKLTPYIPRILGSVDQSIGLPIPLCETTLNLAQIQIWSGPRISISWEILKLKGKVILNLNKKLKF